MINKIKNTFYLLSFLIFLGLTLNFYFSDKNTIATNKSRLNYAINSNNEKNDLPLLKNNTTDAIEYRDDLEVYKKNKIKRKFWELIEKQ